MDWRSCQPVERNCRRLTTVHVMQHVSHASTSCMHPAERLGFAKTRCAMEPKCTFDSYHFEQHFCKGAEGSVNQDRFWQEDWALKHLDSIHDLLCASGSNVSAMALGRCDMIWWPWHRVIRWLTFGNKKFIGVWIVPKLKGAASRCALQQINILSPLAASILKDQMCAFCIVCSRQDPFNVFYCFPFDHLGSTKYIAN